MKFEWQIHSVANSRHNEEALGMTQMWVGSLPPFGDMKTPAAMQTTLPSSLLVATNGGIQCSWDTQVIGFPEAQNPATKHNLPQRNVLNTRQPSHKKRNPHTRKSPTTREAQEKNKMLPYHILESRRMASLYLPTAESIPIDKCQE